MMVIVALVSHFIILVTSLSRVILIHYEWCLDMPSLTDVYLPYAFDYKTDVTIRGSTRFIPLSPIDIGALQEYFNWSPRGTWLLSLCHTHPQHPLRIHLRAHSAAFERALSLCEHGNNDDPHLKWWKSNQNHGQPKQWSFAINHVKSTPKHITYHTHRIPIPMKTKTTSLYHPKRTAKSPTIIPISSIATFYER